MTSSVQIKTRLRDTLGRLACVVGTPLVAYQLYLDWQYTAVGETPLSRFEYMLSHRSEWLILLYAVSLGTFLMLLCVRVSRKHTVDAYDKYIDHLTDEMTALKSDRERLESHASFQGQCIQRFKQIANGIYKAVSRAGEFNSTSSREAKTLLNSSTELAEHLSIGICANDERETLVVGDLLRQILAQFEMQLSKNNVQPHITCSSDLSFVGDPLFAKQILINVIGAPLYRMPKQGKVAICVLEEEGFVHIEVRDNRYVLSKLGKECLKASPAPFDILVEERHLRHICFQNGIGYESSETSTGECFTKVSFPLNPDQVQLKDSLTHNVIPFPDGKPIIFH